MDLNAVGAVEFGRSLEGLGLNLLVRSGPLGHRKVPWWS